MTTSGALLPWPFIWRRLHSLTGIFLVLFLIFHIVTNSQAALPVSEEGRDFIREVNAIHSLPYLRVIELLFLGVPIAIHLLWGVHYLFSSSPQIVPGDGSSPFLSYGRNYAYNLQRLTSWILLVGVIGHVVQMRFLNGIAEVELGYERYYVQRVQFDPRLEALADKLNFVLLEGSEADKIRLEALIPKKEKDLGLKHALEVTSGYAISGNERMALSRDFGTAMLLLVKESFRSLWMVLLYTLLVLAASFHAFNGLWTSMLTWGIFLKSSVQMKFLRLSQLLMVCIALLGMSAIWGTYWLNLGI